MNEARETSFVGWGRQRIAYFDGVEVGPDDLGLDAAMFAEWVQCMGQPRCGGHTKSGRRCDFAPVGFKCDGLEFAQQHRVVMCHLHKPHKQYERTELDGGCVLIKPAKWNKKRKANLRHRLNPLRNRK